MAYIDKYGAKFSDDKEDLLEVPKDYVGVYEIPQGTKYVNISAFRDCNRITTIIVPNSVDNFGEDDIVDENANVLATCTNLSYFIVDSQNINYYSIEGVLCNKKTNVIVAYPLARHELFSLPLELLFTTHEEEGWQGALWFSPYLISHISIPKDHPNYVIESGALYNKQMTRLIKLSPEVISYTMPDSVEFISTCAFIGCNKLKRLSLGNHFSEQGMEVTLPWQLRTCKAISKVFVNKKNVNYHNDKYGAVYYDGDGWQKFLIYYPPSNRTKTVKIPSVEIIESEAFANCTNIKNIIIGNSYIQRIFGYVDTIKESFVFQDTAFYNNQENWKDGKLYIDDILIKVSNDYSNSELVVPAGVDVITSDSISSEHIESVIFEEGVARIYSAAITGKNIKTIKFPRTISEDYLEETQGISFEHSKSFEKILIPKGLRDFYLMYCDTCLHSILVEYDEDGNESPIKPLSDSEREYYENVQECGFPSYIQYSAIKKELQKGVALTEWQIYKLLETVKSEVDYFKIYALGRIERCFERDGIPLKTLIHKDNDGYEETLYYIEQK